MKSLPLPGWLLVLFSTAFIGIWTFAPQKSFSGPVRFQNRDPGQRGKELQAPVLRVQPEYPRTPLPTGPTTEPVRHRPWEVAFTFDDGPHHLHTPRLLDILDQYEVKATFFVNGCWLANRGSQSKRNQEVLKNAHDRGHTIANHSYSHANFFKISEEMQKWEILANEKIIYQTIGVRPTLFRVPYAVRVERFQPLLKKLGYVVAKWNASAPDDEIDDPEQLKDIVMRWIRHYQGGIVMLHDRHTWSVDATALILQSIVDENCRRQAQHRNTFKIVSLSSFLIPPQESPPMLAHRSKMLFCNDK